MFLDVKPNLTDGGGGNYSQHNNINQKRYILKLGDRHHVFGAAGGLLQISQNSERKKMMNFIYKNNLPYDSQTDTTL